MISSITTKIIDNEINANLNLSIIKYIVFSFLNKQNIKKLKQQKINGKPKILYLILPIISNLNKHKTDLVKPHPGQGT